MQDGKARLLRVFPPEAFLFSFVIDPNGEVPSGLIQLTEDGAVMQVRSPATCSCFVEFASVLWGSDGGGVFAQPCTRDPPEARRVEWNQTTVSLKSHDDWQALERQF